MSLTSVRSNVLSARHPLYFCAKFKALSRDQKLSSVGENHLCMNCLNSDHFVRNCKSIATAASAVRNLITRCFMLKIMGNSSYHRLKATWEVITELHSDPMEFFSYDNKLHIYGGMNTCTEKATCTFESYNPHSNTWEVLNSMAIILEQEF